MTNEIKEILDLFYNEYPKEEKILEKYITNLQEENERLKTTQIFIDTQDPEERCGQALYEEMLKRDCENYKQRIDKAIDYINDIDEPELRVIKEILKGEE